MIILKSLKIILWLILLIAILAILASRMTGIGIKIHDGRYLGYSTDTNEWLMLNYRNIPVKQDGPYVFNDKTHRYALTVHGDGIEPSQLKKTQLKDTVEVTVDNKSRTQFRVPLRDQHPRSDLSYPMPERMLVLSDFEGEFDALVNLLQANGVISESLSWIYGDSHLVLLGDMVDRGINVVPLLWLVYKLEAEALSSGGKIHYVLGNHERYLLDGRVKSAAKKYQGSFRVTGLSPTSLWSEDSELGSWLRSKPVLLKIGDVLFVHGGISPQVLAKEPTLKTVDDEAKNHLTLNNSVFRTDTDSVIHDASGLLFYRGLATDMTPYNLGPKASQGHVDGLLAHFDVEHIAIGHSLAQHIGFDYNGKVLRTDVNHAEGVSEGLMIKGQQHWRVDHKGQQFELAPVINYNE